MRSRGNQINFEGKYLPLIKPLWPKEEERTYTKAKTWKQTGGQAGKIESGTCYRNSSRVGDLAWILFQITIIWMSHWSHWTFESVVTDNWFKIQHHLPSCGLNVTSQYQILQPNLNIVTVRPTKTMNSAKKIVWK